MKTLYRPVAGIDVHRMKQVVTILIELEDGGTDKQSREFADTSAICAGWLPGCSATRWNSWS